MELELKFDTDSDSDIDSDIYIEEKFEQAIAIIINK